MSSATFKKWLLTAAVTVTLCWLYEQDLTQNLFKAPCESSVWKSPAHSHCSELGLTISQNHWSRLIYGERSLRQTQSVATYLPPHSSDNWTRPTRCEYSKELLKSAGCRNAPALRHSCSCPANSPSLSLFPLLQHHLPPAHMSGEIISIIPVVVLHHTEHNQS